MNTIGARLRARRLGQGLNQKRLANIAGVTNAAVSKWETNGGESMSAIVALTLARRLNVNPYWLIFGTGEPNEQIRVPELSAESQDLARRIDRLSDETRDALRRLLVVIAQ